MSRECRAFSLIELLIVVAILLIIAAIAIPSLLRSRIAANHASAVASCRVLNTAEVTYSSSYGKGYSSTLLQLGPPATGDQTVHQQPASLTAFSPRVSRVVTLSATRP